MMAPTKALQLEKLGWEFYQDSPEGGKWMLFKDGKMVDQEGSKTWYEIIKPYKKPLM